MLAALIQDEIKKNDLSSHPYDGTEFICSDRGKIGDFSGSEKKAFLNKLKLERGVTVKKNQQHTQRGSNRGERDKAIDMTVFIRLLRMGDPERWRHVVLMAFDTDYMPALELLREFGIHTILVAFKKGNNPVKTEMINQSYLFRRIIR